MCLRKIESYSKIKGNSSLVSLTSFLTIQQLCSSMLYILLKKSVSYINLLEQTAGRIAVDTRPGVRVIFTPSRRAVATGWAHGKVHNLFVFLT